MYCSDHPEGAYVANYRERIQLKVCLPNGTNLSVKVKKFYDFSTFTEFIANRCEVERYRLKFSYHGRPLNEDFAPSDYDMCSNSLIHVSYAMD